LLHNIHKLNLVFSIIEIVLHQLTFNHACDSL